MLTYLRYTLATFCFAASVGCLALWWGGIAWQKYVPLPGTSTGGYFESHAGAGILALSPRSEHSLRQASRSSPTRRELLSVEVSGMRIREVIDASLSQKWLGHFGFYEHAIYFPLWYPALISALAGIAALRLGRRFTLRSAIIATTVVAGLLGMAVGM